MATRGLLFLEGDFIRLGSNGSALWIATRHITSVETVTPTTVRVYYGYGSTEQNTIIPRSVWNGILRLEKQGTP